MPPSIGILGGVGAIASARFHLDLVEAWAARHDAKTDDDFPRIVHLSQSLGLTAAGMPDTIEQTDILYELTRECFEGLDHLAVICNSIAPFVPSPKEFPGIMTPVAACAEALKDVKSAWLLASDSTIRDQIYQRAYPHIEWRVPHCSIASWIKDLIGDAEYTTRKRIKELDIPDGDVIVLGCTELSTRKLPFSWHEPISPTDEMIRILCNTPL